MISIRKEARNVLLMYCNLAMIEKAIAERCLMYFDTNDSDRSVCMGGQIGTYTNQTVCWVLSCIWGL